MRFARLIAAALVVVVIAAGGVFLLAPPTAGQSRVVVQPPAAGELEVFRGGGTRLGVSVRDVDQADMSREKLTSPGGAVVEEVRSDSPAAKAGLKSGDVIVTFDAERVRSARQLERLVDETPAGRSVKLSIQRAGSRLDLDVTPDSSDTALHRFGPFEGRGFPGVEAERWRDFGRRFPAVEFDFDELRELGVPARGRLGVQVQDLTDQLADYFGVKGGVVVTSVEEGSVAAKAGVKAGDVITAVNGEGVDTPSRLRREVARIDEGKPVEVSVTRDKKPLTLKVEVEPTTRRTRPRRVV